MGTTSEEASALVKAALGRLRKDGRLRDVSTLACLRDGEMSLGTRVSLENILTHHYFHCGDYVSALVHARAWRVVAPRSVPAVSSELFILMRLRRWEELLRASLVAIAEYPSDSSFYSVQCKALYELGREPEAREAGTRCLALKARASLSQRSDLSVVPVPPFDPLRSGANVLSYSLYGSNPRYVDGALRNVKDAKLLYPCWTCRFYVDSSVPSSALDDLRSSGAQVLVVQGLPASRYGLFWRFMVCDDPSVERYLVRDCDSQLSVRERLAVDEWLLSTAHFHVMRDWITHTELILAGLWGGVRGALVNVESSFRSYLEGRFWSRTIDQQFLREKVWSTVGQSAVVHDSFFSFGSVSPFPQLADLPGGHVGMGIRS